MHENQHNVFINGVEARIDTIEYKSIEGNDEPKEIKDSQNLELIEFNNETFILKVHRTVNFIPSSMFQLDIKILIRFTIDEEKTMKNFKNYEEVKEYVDNKKIDFFNNVPIGSSLSLLIAQISSTFGSQPIILPPNIDGDR
ncbi:MAG: hypothetical protein ACK5L6_14000 [Anaerorhabdus sp.]|uniref:hypothetical protein n=1 Tax=Anaerorhabdus sp. TaxID=1872524 RepID=UPI003A8B8B70